MTGENKEYCWEASHGRLLPAGAPVEEYLPEFARACRCAARHTDGALEPLYRLHATRLKLLLKSCPPALPLLRQLARYCCMRAPAACWPA